MVKHKSVQFIAGILPLILGVFIITVHNVWISNWEIMITLLGWFLFVAGSFRLILTDFWISMIQKNKDHFPVTIVGSLMLIIGLFLVYFGYLV